MVKKLQRELFVMKSRARLGRRGRKHPKTLDWMTASNQDISKDVKSAGSTKFVNLGLNLILYLKIDKCQDNSRIRDKKQLCINHHHRWIGYAFQIGMFLNIWCWDHCIDVAWSAIESEVDS